MQIRLASTGDIPVLKNLWMDSFDEKPIFCEKFFQVRAVPDRIALVEEEGQIVSALHMLPCYFHCGSGEAVRGSNLVGAATFEKYRGKKYMERLITWSIALMKSRGEVLCSLKPFLHKFYRKYGWECCCRIYKYIFQPENLKRIECAYGTRQDNIQIFEKFSHMDIVRLNEIYEKYNSALFLKRSLPDWEFFLWDINTSDSCMVMSEYGYCVCIIEEKCIKIVETVFNDEEALFAMIKKIGDVFPGRALELSSLRRLKTGVADGRMKQEDFTMIRIIDLEALSGKIPSADFNLPWGIYRVEDEVAPWNCGIFIISESNGRIIIEKTSEKCDYKINISELTGNIFNEANTVIFEGY